MKRCGHFDRDFRNSGRIRSEKKVRRFADMAKKRKAEATGLDESERKLYTSFSTAANNISQLYTQVYNQRKLAFHAGERHYTDRVCQWLRHQQNSSIAIEEILQFLQGELGTSSGDEMALSPRHHAQNINLLAAPQHPHSLSSANQATSGGSEHASLGLVSRGELPDHNKLAAFSGPISCPNRRSIPIFGVTQGGHSFMQYSSGNFGRRTESISEQHHETPPNGTHDSDVQHYNLSTPASHLGAMLSTSDPLVTRPDQPYGEHDANMEMHSDGDAESY